MELARQRSPSFDKCWREVDRLLSIVCPSLRKTPRSPNESRSDCRDRLRIERIAPDGSTLTLASYAGPTGRLKVESAAEDVECRLALTSDDGKCSFGMLADEQALVLPAGTYRVLYGLLYRPLAHQAAAIVLPGKGLPIPVLRQRAGQTGRRRLAAATVAGVGTGSDHDLRITEARLCFDSKNDQISCSIFTDLAHDLEQSPVGRGTFGLRSAGFR